jgi:hypothetical protein
VPRLLVLAVLVGLALATEAMARPTVAVVPIRGDSDDEVTELVVDVVSKSAKVVKPKAVVKAIGKLGIAGELDAKDAQKLQKQLAADAVLQGRVRGNGKRRTLRVTVFARGKKPGVFELKITSKGKLRSQLRDELASRIPDSDDGERVARKKKRDADDDDDEPRSKAAKKEKAKAKEKKNKKDKDKKKARVARADDDDDDDDREVKKREKQRTAQVRDKKKKQKKKKKTEKKSKKKRSRDDDDDDEADDGDDGDDELAASVDGDVRVAASAMVRVDSGMSLGVRRLTYTAQAPPPRVGTFAPAARIEGELYPFAGDPKSPAAGLGIAGEYEQTIGLSIQIPGGPTVPIDQGHYAIGGRYRLAAGTSATVAFGLDLVKRRYVADRTGLPDPRDLDAPDVSYTAISPGVGLRAQVAPSAALFAGLGAYLILDTGPIQERESFGAATVYGGELAAGVDVALSERLGLRLAGEATQINFTFKGNGMEAMARGVTAAVDRTFGVAATLAVKY